MRNCPKCHVDFSDDFSFCEFDGFALDQVFEEKQSLALLAMRYGQSRFVQIIGVALFLSVITVFIMAKNFGQRSSAPAQQTASARVEPSSFYIETPREARDFVEQPSAEEPQREGKNAEKPGVEVYLPKTTEPNARAKSKGNDKVTEPEPDVRPVQTPAPTQRPVTQPAPEPRSPAPQSPSNSSTRPQIAANRQLEEEPVSRPRTVTNSPVNMNLVRVRSHRTESGVRYDLTFTLQQNEGRVIRWERLNLSTRSASGLSHSEVVPFYQRLGSSGSLNFTVSVEMRGRSDADLYGRITCTGVGTDVDGRNIKTDFTARVNP
jgi:outer membrane biosynthesis protein TonB